MKLNHLQKMFNIKRYKNFEEADVETSMERAAQLEEKKLLQREISDFNSGKSRLDALLKSDPDDMEKKSIQIIDENSILPTYWSMIKAERRAEKAVEKAKDLKDKLQSERSKLSDPDSRVEASNRIKEINLEITSLNKEKKDLDLVAKTLDKQIKDKISLLKQKMNIS